MNTSLTRDKKRPKAWMLQTAYNLGWFNTEHNSPNPFNKINEPLMFNEFARGYRAARALIEYEQKLNFEESFK